MKKTVFLGLLAMVLAFGFIGCDEEDNNYNVTFNLDGGNIGGNTSPVQIPVESGGTITNLPNPQKANYTFGGWFTGTNGAGNEFTSTTLVNSNITVFAKWTNGSGDDENKLSGTYSKSGTSEGTSYKVSITFSGNAYNVTHVWGNEIIPPFSGTYSLDDNIITFSEPSDGGAFIETATLSNDRNSFAVSGIGGNGEYLNGTYTKE